MATEVVMPQMGESIAEGTITKWLVKVGEKVERDQPLFEISTDKVDAEIPSPASGTLLEIRHQEGETVPVNAVVAMLGGEGETAGEAAPAPEAPKRAEAPKAAAETPKPAPAAPAVTAATAATPAAAKSAPAPSDVPAAARPEGDFDYDLVIVGSGPGGYVAAIRAGQLGFKVACVEKDPKFGGTCTHRGCIPTKALLHSAEVLEQVRKAGDFGVGVAEPTLDIAKVHEHKRGIVAKSAGGIETLFKKYKVEGIQGYGRLTGPHAVEVEGDGGEKRTLSTRYVMIATGSVPREIGVAPTDGERIVNSDHLLEMERVPASIIVLGAGAVGTEFASVFRSFGSEVTLVEMLPRVLPIEDEEVSKEVERQLKKRGMQVMTGTKLAAAERTESGVKVKLDKGGKESEVEAEMLLVAIGRAPVSGDIGLAAVGVETDRGYIPINGVMQTKAPNVYAIGDVVNTPWLAHIASAEGILAVEHMAGEEVRPLNYDLTPSCTYCDPEVGSVGLSEAKAKERGYDVAVGKFSFMASGKARILGKAQGFVKIVRDTKYDEILGVHIVGPHATDLIAEACVALQLEATAEELFRTIHAHPTLSEAVMEAAHASHGAAIHS
ncbi:MAG: dihydrolipoyl dehydrogenase [Holophagales bacterium]|nr:dihydrolipoyl dehydrogenase [Holophagales bacterium]